MTGPLAPAGKHRAPVAVHPKDESPRPPRVPAVVAPDLPRLGEDDRGWWPPGVEWAGRKRRDGKQPDRPPRPDRPRRADRPAAPDVAGPLFAATMPRTPSPVAYQPEPLVFLDGDLVATAKPAGGVLPAGLLAVDRLSFEWGRSSLYDQAEPASARLRLVDVTRTFVSRPGLIGLSVELGYYMDAALYPGSAFESWQQTNWRGRIADVTATRRTLNFADAGPVAVHMLDLTCTSILIDLANIVVPAGTVWPWEPFTDRRNRVAALCAPVISGTLMMRDFWLTQWAGQLDVSGENALTLLRQLYDSASWDRMSFNPMTNSVEYVQRRDFNGIAGLTQLWQHPLVRNGKAFARALAITPTDGRTSGELAFVDGQNLEYSDAVSLNQASRLTRIDVGWIDPNNAHAAATTTGLVPGTSEASEGSRALTVSTMHAGRTRAELVAVDWAEVASQEGRSWLLDGPLRLNTRRLGGFETLSQVRWLLAGFETPTYAFFQRTYLPEFGIAPLLAVMGGTVSFERGGWVLDLIPCPIPIGDNNAGLPGLHVREAQAAGTTLPLSDIDESLTIADLRWVHRGFGQNGRV